MDSDKFTQRLSLLLWFSAIASIATIAAYLLKLGNLRLSSDPAVWGQLGDYLAGTLGTYFSMLAFFGVVLALTLQSRQLVDARKHLKLEETQRLIGKISDAIDLLLRVEPVAIAPPRPRASLALLLIGTSNAIDQRKYGEAIQGWMADMQYERGLLAIELDQLVWSLEHYRIQGGSDFLLFYYRRRYRVVAYWIENCGAPVSERVQVFFGVDEVRKEMRSDG